MIRYLQGEVLFHEERKVILLNQGIGYEIHTPQPEIFAPKQNIGLFIHTHVREDAFQLFGFEDKKGLDFFEMLLKINGVGPKMALSIMSMPLQELVHAIHSQDEKKLSSISGVGKKLAQRLLLELDPKKMNLEEVPQGFIPSSRSKTDVPEEALEALEALGYKRKDILKKAESLAIQAESTEEWVRFFLQNS